MSTFTTSEKIKLQRLNLLSLLDTNLNFFTPTVLVHQLYICEGELHSFHMNSSLFTLKNINFWTSQKNGECNIALFLRDYSHFCM
ncbi:hypothetical protein C0J52_22657 [Blattella germanica]|nr:hypothetical protein C0J52_22657 [Blattella germanica]